MPLFVGNIGFQSVDKKRSLCRVLEYNATPAHFIHETLALANYRRAIFIYQLAADWTP
jgi:hypothetical protein